ncbi:MAG: FAD-binding oxidoreductase [Methylobacteriaceae bacterium]|nr:FAD-binding oxidoreductase [Methylobacteriaceae bacterium]
MPLQAHAQISAPSRPSTRVRPGDAAWPTEAIWEQLNRDVSGALVRVQSSLAACLDNPQNAACEGVFRLLKNPYAIGDDVALTENLGWVGAWTSQPSAYAVAARTAQDVAAAVNFARIHNLRVVVKGGGHSYQGASNSADSLLVWTRKMNAITLHDGFIAEGCNGAPQPAVTIEAGALWGQAYNAVAVTGGRYVQGGGCLTVGVAGLIQGGGFGSFSKKYGLAAASLLQAEIVTADGVIRIANACTNSDLFWAIKGGGGGTFGVVTKLTLKTHDLPNFFGAVNATIKAGSDDAYRRLITRVMTFYRDSLFNAHWGEQIVLRSNNILTIRMVFQGLDQAQAIAVWQPFFDWIGASPQEFTLVEKPVIVAVPAQHFWNPAVLKTVPGIVVADGRPGAPEGNIVWAGDAPQSGQVLHGLQSAWLPESFLRDDQRERLCDAFFVATRHWAVELHFNKGLAGAPAEVITAARETAMNPAVCGAFALAIIAGGQGPSVLGIAGHEPDITDAHRRADAIGQAMKELTTLVANAGSYVSESNFFENDWQQSFWGANYPRLLATKDRYDPEGLLFVHHGVGSEGWSDDGFTRLSR